MISTFLLEKKGEQSDRGPFLVPSPNNGGGSFYISSIIGTLFPGPATDLE